MSLASRILFEIKKGEKVKPESRVQKLLDEAEQYLGKKIKFQSRDTDPQANYRSEDFSDPENGIIFYNPDAEHYNSQDGQTRIAHELMHIIYFHKEKVFHPQPWPSLNIEKKLIAERMGEFIEDLFVLEDLERLGFGKDDRYRKRIEKITLLLSQGHDLASLNFPKAPAHQQELMTKQFAVICLMDKNLMTGKNFSTLKFVMEAKFGKNSMEQFKITAEGLTNILNRNENLKDKIQKANKFAFTRFGIRHLVKLS